MPRIATSQDTVLKSLRKMLASGRLKPGQQIIQDALASRLGVSRVPVREALKVLQAEGRVIHELHRGYFVAALDVEDLTEIYRLRTILEDEALRIGIPKVTAKDVAQIKALHQECLALGQRGEVTNMAAHNRKFHIAIFRLCGQERLISMIENLWDSLDAYRVIFLNSPENRKRTSDDHARIVTAVAAKDLRESLRLHAAHNEHALKALRKQLLEAAAQ